MANDKNDLKELLTAAQLDGALDGRRYTLKGIVITAIIFAVLFLVCWIVWKDYFSPIDRAGQVVVAKPAGEVSGKPTVTVSVQSVQAYPDAVKKKLNLSKSVAGDVKKKVVAASKIAASYHPHTVTTLLDTGTGQFETYVRTDPLPWVAFTSRGGAGVYYGMKNGEQAVRLQARQDLLQFKAIHVGAIASMESVMSTGQTDVFVGIGGEYRW